MSFPARYHGTCPHCYEHINPGDPIVWDEEEHDVHHEQCRDAPQPRFEVICNDCWMAKPCFCEEAS